MEEKSHEGAEPTAEVGIKTAGAERAKKGVLEIGKSLIAGIKGVRWNTWVMIFGVLGIAGIGAWNHFELERAEETRVKTEKAVDHNFMSMALFLAEMERAAVENEGDECSVAALKALRSIKGVQKKLLIDVLYVTISKALEKAEDKFRECESHHLERYLEAKAMRHESWGPFIKDLLDRQLYKVDTENMTWEQELILGVAMASGDKLVLANFERGRKALEEKLATKLAEAEEKKRRADEERRKEADAKREADKKLADDREVDRLAKEKIAEQKRIREKLRAEKKVKELNPQKVAEAAKRIEDFEKNLYLANLKLSAASFDKRGHFTPEAENYFLNYLASVFKIPRSELRLTNVCKFAGDLDATIDRLIGKIPDLTPEQKTDLAQKMKKGHYLVGGDENNPEIEEVKDHLLFEEDCVDQSYAIPSSIDVYWRDTFILTVTLNKEGGGLKEGDEIVEIDVSITRDSVNEDINFDADGGVVFQKYERRFSGKKGRQYTEEFDGQDLSVYEITDEGTDLEEKRMVRATVVYGDGQSDGVVSCEEFENGGKSRYYATPEAFEKGFDIFMILRAQKSAGSSSP